MSPRAALRHDRLFAKKIFSDILKTFGQRAKAARRRGKAHTAELLWSVR